MLVDKLTPKEYELICRFVYDVAKEAEKHTRSTDLPDEFHIGYNLGYNTLHMAMNNIRERYRELSNPRIEDYNIERTIAIDARIQEKISKILK